MMILLCRCRPSLILSKQISLKSPKWFVFRGAERWEEKTVIGCVRENNHRVTKHLLSLKLKATLLLVLAKLHWDTEGRSFDAHWKMILTAVWLQSGVVERSFLKGILRLWVKEIISYYHLYLYLAPNETLWEEKLPVLIPMSYWILFIWAVSVFCTESMEKFLFNL